MRRLNQLKSKKKALACFIMVAIFYAANLYAQSGQAGIDEANTKVRSYFASGINLMYAVGAIVGLIGAIKVLCAKN